MKSEDLRSSLKKRGWSEQTAEEMSEDIQDLLAQKEKEVLKYVRDELIPKAENNTDDTDADMGFNNGIVSGLDTLEDLINKKLKELE